MNKAEQIKKKAKADLYFFNKEVLGYSRMRPNPHQELCDIITSKEMRRKLILMPRGSFKSSVLTVGHSLHTLVNDPNHRILVCHELQKNANKYVNEIRTHIDSNLKFRALFGDWVSKELWRNSEFLINTRTAIKKEPSVMAASLEKGVTVGLHFDTIILDDPCSPRNTQTLEQVEKTIEFYKLLLSVLEPGGNMYVIGTRWNIHDLYGWILDEAGTERKKFQIIVKKAVSKDGEYLMPDILSKEFLDDVRETQGEDIFCHQYLNEPLTSAQQIFNTDDIKIYKDTESTPPDGSIHFLTVDCAVSQSKESDYTAFVMNAVDYDHNYFIREAIRVRAKPSEIVDRIFELIDQYQPFMTLGVETSMVDQVITQLLYAEMDKRNKWFAVKELREGSRKSKEERIRWLQPKVAAGKIYLKEEHKELFDEIKFYPQTKHDDLIDALKSQTQVTFPSDTKPIKGTKYEHLNPRERQIWEHVETLGSRRKIKRKKWITF